MSRVRYAYVHGFASSSESRKGLALADRFLRECETVLERPDLNRPSFADLSVAAALEGLDELDAKDPAQWRLVGSSMGGYIAALWAAKNPGKVDRLMLLCPGFDASDRWPEIFGEDGLRRWKAEGRLEIPDAIGQPVAVHYGLVEELGKLEGRPAAVCPTRMIHGLRDEVVPIASSRTYAAENSCAHLIEVDDDHGLIASLDTIFAEAREFFGLESKTI